MPLYWFDQLSVGIPEVDAQHQELIRLINRLDDAIANRQGYPVLTRMVDDLIAYARQHFATEETLMQCGNYPRYQAHLREHEAFNIRVMELCFHPDDPGNSPMAVSEYLHHWLIAHIGTVDKLMGEYLTQ